MKYHHQTKHVDQEVFFVLFFNLNVFLGHEENKSQIREAPKQESGKQIAPQQ